MIVTEQNYLKILGSIEAATNQVIRFLQFKRRPSARMLFKIRSDIQSIIAEEIRQNRKRQLDQIKEEQQKRIEEQQSKIKELFQKRQKRND